MLDRLGASDGISSDIWSWDILDRTREGGTISAEDGDGSTTITFEVAEWAYSSTDLGYGIVGDVLRFESGALGRITAVVISTTGSDIAKVTVTKVGTGAPTWAAADLADTEKFGHAFNAFPEASSAPVGRLYLPTEDFNVLNILRRSFSISGSEFTNKTWLGDGSAWYFTQEDLEMKEFARDREISVIFGVQDQDASSGAKVSRGILDWAIAQGTVNGFSAAAGVSETDVQNQIRDMLIEGVSNDIFILCGAQFLADFQRALRDYAIAGAMNYGSLGDNTAGLDFQNYKFMGKTLHIAYYELFDDSAVLPYSGTPSASKYDFGNFSLWLDFGSDSNGQKLMTLKHKELNGQSRKFIHGYEVGMMNPSGANGGMVANGDDRFTIHYLSEIGIEVRLPNRLGVLKANAA